MAQTLLSQAIANLKSAYATAYGGAYLLDIAEIREGHTSMVDEIVEQLTATNSLQRLKAIMCSIAGQGFLYNGLVQGLQRHLRETILYHPRCFGCRRTGKSGKLRYDCNIIGLSIHLPTLFGQSQDPQDGECPSDRCLLCKGVLAVLERFQCRCQACV